MKHPIHHVLVACAWAGAALGVSGCERALDVVDQLQSGGAAVAGDPSADPPEAERAGPLARNASCACASSASLLALTCGGGEVPDDIVPNDLVQTTRDGSVVVFSRCSDSNSNCRVLRWQDGSSVEVGTGLLLGIDAAAERMLLEHGGDESLIEVGGAALKLPLVAFDGHGLLNGAGDTLFGYAIRSQAEPRNSEVETLSRADGRGRVETLGELPGGIIASDVNPDGTALVGTFASGQDEAFHYGAFRWSAAGGLRFDFPGAPARVTLWPEAISSDGSVIAGRALDQTHFVWSETSGYKSIAVASWRSETSISADGSVVVGSLVPDDGIDSSAFRWTAESGAVALTPGRASGAVAMSEDGAVIVALGLDNILSGRAAPDETFVWNAADGTRTLDEITSERGIDTSGWEFGTPRALSGDGRVLLGRGTCGGVPTLYRIVLSD